MLDRVGDVVVVNPIIIVGSGADPVWMLVIGGRTIWPDGSCDPGPDLGDNGRVNCELLMICRLLLLLEKL